MLGFPIISGVPPKLEELETQAPAPALATDQIVTFNDLKREIFEPSGCVNCHNYTKTEAGIRSHFTPGNPEGSEIYARIKNGSMPKGGAAVNTSRLEYLEQYILNNGEWNSFYT